jgi:hypothetical protein
MKMDSEFFRFTQTRTTEGFEGLHTPVLASVLDIFEPGTICQHPKADFPSSITTFRRFAAFIDAMVLCFRPNAIKVVFMTPDPESKYRGDTVCLKR